MGRAIVGIDPSGRRLAVAAVRAGMGRPVPAAPPAVFDLRGERETSRVDEAEVFLGDYVARNGLAGCAARLCIPAERAFTSRVAFPRLREKDLRAAVELELERLFPFPAARLRYGWRRLDTGPVGKTATLLVVAAEAAWLGRWEEAAARAGLRLVAAVPSGSALAAALSAAFPGWDGPAALSAVIREAGGGAECTVYHLGEPAFTAYRSCPPEAAEIEALALLGEGLVDLPVPADGAFVTVVAPSGWCDGETIAGDVDPPVRRGRDIEGAVPAAPGHPAGVEERPAAGRVAGAWGAAVGGKGIDLLASRRERSGARAARAATWALAVAAFVLALAWPAAVGWRTRAELARLDAEVALLKPAVEAVRKSHEELAAVEARIAVLREVAAGRAEPLAILRELTDRMPQGTWLTSLRIEERKTEMEGLSPGASEIFPILARDGRFKGVEFASPITRQPDNHERFRIRAEYVPEGPAAPAGSAAGGPR